MRRHAGAHPGKAACPLERTIADLAPCAEKDWLLLVDEVQTGVGRTGTLFCLPAVRHPPDAAPLPKGIAGGHALRRLPGRGEVPDVSPRHPRHHLRRQPVWPLPVQPPWMILTEEMMGGEGQGDYLRKRPSRPWTAPWSPARGWADDRRGVTRISPEVAAS
ncbi:MAG: aminotransferase class III-fold pyridoxal phosphate-dependent enzyme [Flavonifractor plautii]